MSILSLQLLITQGAHFNAASYTNISGQQPHLAGMDHPVDVERTRGLHNKLDLFLLFFSLLLPCYSVEKLKQYKIFLSAGKFFLCVFLSTIQLLPLQ